MDDALVPPCSSTPNWMHVWVVMQTLEWSLVTWKMCSFLRQRTICDRSQRWKPILKRTWKNGYELSKSNPAPLSCLMAFDVHCKIKIRSTFRLCFSPPPSGTSWAGHCSVKSHSAFWGTETLWLRTTCQPSASCVASRNHSSRKTSQTGETGADVASPRLQITKYLERQLRFV